MTSPWSGEQVVAKYTDIQASAMAVDCLGVWAALGGRRALTMVNLKKPEEKPSRSLRQSKWDVSCIQWNPNPSHAHLFVTACNQRLDLFSWKNGNITHHNSMKGHSRIISDVGWCPFDVNVIASCSVDTYINLWDVRDPKRPTNSFHTVSGAYQVKWNKVTNNIFATTHEGELRVWDTRKGPTALHYIAAHLSKIHGLDWSPNSESDLATCSQDCSVKFWDINNTRQCKGSLNPGSPVWRARYTPFGQGIVTVVVPQQLRRGDNSLHLWNTSRNNPVHQFVGHQDVILEFQWRKQQEGSSDYQLVTWSKDQSLRIWKIDPQLQKRCGHDVGDINDSSENEMTSQTLHESRSLDKDLGNGDTQRQMSLSPDSGVSQQPQTLQQEFNLMNTNIPNIEVIEMDADKRTCRITAVSGGLSVGLKMTFPMEYPYIEPTFEFLDQNLKYEIKQRLHKVLTDTSLLHARRNTSCIEPCLRQLSHALDHPLSLQPEERRTPEVESRPFTLTTSSSKQQYISWQNYNVTLQDMNIPFPRTSGAKFCSAGYLVVFGRAHEARKGPSGTDITPKALCDLTDYASKARLRSSHQSKITPNFYNFPTYSRSPPTPVAENVSIKEWYYRPQIPAHTKRKQRVKDTDNKPNLAPVKLYDASCILPIHKDLGKNYIIDRSDIPAMCRHNASAAGTVGRRDLVQLWSLIEITASEKLKPSKDPDEGSPWAKHPFGKEMLKSMMDFYMKIYDVQTLAMVICTLWNRQDATVQQTKKEKIPQSASVEYVPPNMDMADMLSSSTDSGWRVLKIRRSNSWSGLEDSFEDYRIEDDAGAKEKESDRIARLHENNCRLLDPTAQNQYDVFLKSYANILYHWGFSNQSKHVLKFMTQIPDSHKGIEFGVQCSHCLQESRGAQCGFCKNLAFNCSICHIGVRGNSLFCLNCGHGGHTSHILTWFKEGNECPTGCGCKCVQGKTFITM